MGEYAASVSDAGTLTTRGRMGLDPTVTEFASLQAEGATLMQKMEYGRAIDAFSRALNLRPDHKDILVSRAKCYINLGKPNLALDDADTVLKISPESYKGIHIKAEALYASGFFEHALVFFHRGFNLRPELSEFRLGIQKASEAIDNAIGEGSQPADLGASQRNQNSVPPLNMSATSAPVDRSERSLLGPIYADKAFLEELANDPSLQSPGLGVDQIAKKSVQYLETRTEFWRQQQPPTAPNTARSAMNTTRSTKSTPRKSKPLPPPAETKRKSNEEKKKQVQEETRFAVQTLENVTTALDYGDPALGLKFAYNFLDRLDKLSLSDKPRILANLYSAMGNTYLELQNYPEAAEFHRKDLDISVEEGFEDAYVRALANLGRTYAMLGNQAQAIAYFEKRVAHIKVPTETAGTLVQISQCHFDSKNFEKAQESAESALQLARQVDDKDVQLAALFVLGRSLEKLESFIQAGHMLEEHHTLAVSLNNSGAADQSEKRLNLLKDNGHI